MRPDEPTQPGDLADRLDEALERLWQGEAGELSRLLDDGDGTAGRQKGALGALGQWRDHVPGVLPERIGNYTIVRELGRGGMGVVYEARQLHPHRAVALKLIHPRGRSDPLHARLFQREVEVLARLRHPGIAALYSAETTVDGQPFYVMELVQGEPLLIYAKGRTAPPDPGSRLAPLGRFGPPGARPALDMRQRLELFAQICDAISYAHQRGVIHRDLKPSNVMVSAEAGGGARLGSGRFAPAVKVLDFGLAHLTDPETEQTALLTQTGRIVGTLAYMSPEQARGDMDAIDLRTDVYALGVMLFELLTGRLPYDLQQAAPHQAPAVIGHTPPWRASTLNRALRGELDTIIGKALAKEPAERYQSAAALAEDVRRYLAGEPILACPPSAWYQLRKLIGRHRVAAAVAVLTFGIVAALAVTATGQARRAASERDRAQAALHEAEAARDTARVEATKAQRVQGFLQDILGSVNPDIARGRDVEVLRDLLTEAERRVQTELADQPDVAGAVRGTIGRTYLALGLYAEAEPHLLAAVDHAEAHREDDPTRLAAALEELGMLYQSRSQNDEAEKAFARALLLRRENVLAMKGLEQYPSAASTGAVTMIAPTLDEDHVDLAGSYGLLGRHFGVAHEYDRAAAYLDRALALRQKALGPDDPLTIRSLDDMAWLLARRGQSLQAEPLLRDVLAAYRRSYGPDHPQTATVMHNLAAALKANASYAEAEQTYAAVIEIQRRVLGPEHTALASALVSRADLLKTLGRLDEAAVLLREALPIQRKHLGDSNDDVAATLAHLGSVQIARGDLAGGELHYQQALAMYEGLHGSRHTGALICRNALATIQVRTQRYAEAEAQFREILEIFHDLHGPEHPGAFVFKSNLSHVLTQLGRLDEAEALCREVLAFRRQTLSESHPQVAIALHNLAGILQAQGRLDEASPVYEEAIAMYRQTKGERSTELANSLTRYATLLEQLDDREKAAGVYAEAFDIHCGAHELGHPNRASTTTNFGRFLLAEPRFTDPALIECVLADYAALSADRADSLDLQGQIQLARGEALLREGDPQTAEEFLKEALAYFRDEYGLENEFTQRAAVNLANLFAGRGEEEKRAEFARLLREPSDEPIEPSSAP